MVVRDILLTVSGTVDGSRHDNAAKRTCAQEEKMQTYADKLLNPIFCLYQNEKPNQLS